ncbi:MAG: hypothetical protein ACR2RD_08155 [Woeseiaceae bacterium]
MRELKTSELELVAGGTGVCTPQNSGNDYGGITDTGSIGDDLVEIYEGVVAATSHVIERVANAL